MQEDTEKKNKNCLYCGNFEKYYTKGLYRFESTKHGICRHYNVIVSSNNTCAFWKNNSHRIYLSKRAISRALYEILTNISAIRQIIQENQDEGKNL